MEGIHSLSYTLYDCSVYVNTMPCECTTLECSIDAPAVAIAHSSILSAVICRAQQAA